MASKDKSVRQSITLPPRVVRQVRSMAKARNTSASRILVDLVESGLEAHERAKQRFLEMADRLAASRDPAEQARIKEELARLTFGAAPPPYGSRYS
jgi:hypothetical protein